MKRNPKNSCRFLVIAIAIFLVNSTSLAAPGFKKPFSLIIRERRPTGTIYQGGSSCFFKWQVRDAKQREIPVSYLAQNFARTEVTIVAVSRGRETTLAIVPLAVTTQSYRWTIPKKQVAMSYWLLLQITPKTTGEIALESKLQLLVRPFVAKKRTALDLSKCVRVIMDWNGKRGYYRRMSPKKAWQMARKACLWIRKNASATDYQDYLITMEKIEQTPLAPLTIYCEQDKARLQIDHWAVGFFKQWDPNKKKYVLTVPLPVNSERPYAIKVKHGKKHYRTLHTHIGESECIIPYLYTQVKLAIATPGRKSRCAIEGKPLSAWNTRHLVELYMRKVQVVKVVLQNGPTLRIIANPRRALAVVIEKQGDYFVLVYNKRRYQFIGNEINLTRF